MRGDGTTDDSDVPVDVSGGASSADLQLSMTDSPDPVTSANDILYHLVTHNAGPDRSDGVTLTVTLDGQVTEQSMPPACSGPVGDDITCDLGDIDSGTSTPVDIVVQAPSVTEQEVVSFLGCRLREHERPHSRQRLASQNTTVNPPDTGSGSGYVPPEGGSVSTGTNATAGDPVALSMVLPPGGPGGTAKVVELPNCKPFGPPAWAPRRTGFRPPDTG